MHKLLVIDDDPRWVETIRDKLERRHVDVQHSFQAENGLERALEEHPDIIILDLLFPNQRMQGEDVLAELKANEDTRDIPIIVYSIKGNEHSTRLLVSQYSPSPIVPREREVKGQVVNGRKWEVLELVQLIFGLLDDPARSRFIYKDRHTLEIEEHFRNVWVDGNFRRLTPRDGELLSILDKHRGEFVSAKKIGKLARRMASDEYAIRTAIHALRRKVEPNPASKNFVFILNDPGYGYMLIKGDPPPPLPPGLPDEKHA